MVVRSTVFNIAFYVNTTLFLLGSVPLFLLPARPFFVVVKTWCRSTVWLAKLIVGLDFNVRGLENLPAGGYLAASKHQSAWETLALVPLFDYPTFILKKQLTRIPLFGWYLLKFGMISVDRTAGMKALKAMTREAQDAIKDGRQIVIFPEGTRRAPGAAPDYKPGVANLYSACACPCVPIALNSGLYWPRRSWLRYPGTIQVRILPPIEAGLARRAFMQRLEADIETASDALLAEAATDGQTD